MNVLISDQAKAKQAAELLLTLPGIPYLYMEKKSGCWVKSLMKISDAYAMEQYFHAGFYNWQPMAGTKNGLSR